MATVCNMSAEVGSTSCIFPFTEAMSRYLAATNRPYIADTVRQNTNLVVADEGSEQHYDEVYEIDLDKLEPHINGPFIPDLSHPLSKFAGNVNASSWPLQISQAMVGSCTNSSYEDLKKVANMVKEASTAGLRPKIPMLVTAGSEKIQSTVRNEGILEEIENAGATVLSTSCGPCVGQWNRAGAELREPNSVISSYNRNFVARHDGNPATHSFVTSPEIVTAFAYAGSLDFDPVHDYLTAPSGEPFRFSSPGAEELPVSFSGGDTFYQAPGVDESSVEIAVSPESDRLQLLTPFEPWKDGNSQDMAILIKVKGPWYNYRGHLENISNNLLTAADNAFIPTASQSRGHAISQPTGMIESVPEVAKSYKEAHVKWCIIGDTNYGEGSSREHAALEPRFLGGIAVIAKSFARIHESNLKKQGMLALTFADPQDYDRLQKDDKVSVLDIEDIQPGKQLRMLVRRNDGTTWLAMLNHSYQAGQIPWIVHGSALNYMRSKATKP
ncbi:hypothetical protein PRZ48_005538 [Zasmidium cellare]|uniref:Aconitate hydratase, mitochondrial n=1 Tax=Zasmidium cellare TaxID=395010 RepID=A0ABR0EKS5_ZASCE|nr:hypothetical protein PRZ48_005538 [Zasmidium cellare]